MDPNWTALADAIKKRRKALRYSQPALAEAAGLGRSTIQKLEWATAENVERETMARLEFGLQWAPGSVDAVLNGGDPSIRNEGTAGPTLHAEPSDSLTGLPASVLDELADGEVYATDIHNLTQDGGITLITVAVRRAGEPGAQISPEQRRYNFRAWSRVQRQLNNLPPLEWEPGDPEEWKEESEHS